MSIEYHHSRRPKNFIHRKVSEALPEYFGGDYPKFITFLEKYYQFLDSDGTHSFGKDVKQSFDLRDVHATQQLNNLISEIASGLPNGDAFTDPRYSATRLAELQRNKGTRFAVEEFFRLFFQEAVEVEFPKKDIFTVGSSKIGPDSLKIIQNGQLYQVFSVLIKTALSTNTWEELYKKFMHPAGFFIGTRIVSDTEADAGIGLMPLAILDSSAGPTVTSEAVITLLSPFTQMTALLDSDGNGTNDFRVGLDQLVSVYQTLTATQLDKFYGSINTLIGVNSFKFDDSDIGDSAGTSRPDFSLTTETMDNEMFSNYLIDSTF